MDDQINHPEHYGGEGDIYEVIRVIEAWQLNFNLGNVLKYVGRAGKKPDVSELEDLRKAAWYLAREIALLEKEEAVIPPAPRFPPLGAESRLGAE